MSPLVNDGPSSLSQEVQRVIRTKNGLTNRWSKTVSPQPVSKADSCAPGKTYYSWLTTEFFTLRTLDPTTRATFLNTLLETDIDDLVQATPTPIANFSHDDLSQGTAVLRKIRVHTSRASRINFEQPQGVDIAQRIASAVKIASILVATG